MTKVGSEDRRLTLDLVALYDITREFAVELEYELGELEDIAADDKTRHEYGERRRTVRAARRNLPLGTDRAAREGLIAAQDAWIAELESLRAR